MEQIAQDIIKCFKDGGHLFTMGNGGSLAHASHLSEELISHGYPAIALNDSNVLSALANDFSYDEVFSRYIHAVGKKGDILLTFSTSGKSINIIKASERAKIIGIKVIEFPRNFKGTTEEIQDEQQKLLHQIYKEIIK